jgi:F-type H+-transporting ATPase subunit b
VIESVTRQPEMRDEITGIQWLGFASPRRASSTAWWRASSPSSSNEHVLAAEESGGGSFLVSPDVGLMIWTLVVFVISMYILSKGRVPKIAEALDKRQQAIEDAIDTAEQTRTEAQRLLEEYRERLSDARGQADDIVARARKTAENNEAESVAEAKRKREEMLAQARRDIQQETRRAIQEIRAEVADLTVMATEKVTRKTLTADDQKRLVEEALSELDFAALSGDRSAASAMEEIASVYARSLFEVAQEQGKLDDVRDQLGEFADALDADRELQVFFFSPYFSTPEKEDGLDKASPAPSRSSQLPQAADREAPHAGRVPRARDFDELWQRENKLLPSSHLGDRARQEHGQADRRPHRRADGPEDRALRTVDPDILGGIVVRVGNSIIDSSIRARLDSLRKQVAKA